MFHMKRFLAVCLGVIMLFSAAGCSTSSDKLTEDRESDQTIKTDTVSGDKRNVRFMYWGSPVEKAAIEHAIQTFEEAHPDIKVEGLNVPSNDFYTKLTAMIAGNEAPDISYSGAWKLKLGEDGVIYEFNELAKMYPEMSQDGLIEYCEWKWAPDKSAGPFQANVTTSLMYNQDIFEEMGLPLPPTKVEDAWTWDEFVDTAMKLTLDKQGRNAYDEDFDSSNIKQFGIKMSTGWNGYMPFIFSNGGNYLSEDGAEFGLNKPEATEVIQKISDLINVQKVHPTTSQSASIPAPASALQSRRVAMVIDGSWCHADLGETDMNWGVGVLPKYGADYKTFFHGGSLVIYKNAEDLEATCKLYNWITNPKQVMSLHQGVWLPQYEEWYTNEELVDQWANEELPARPAGFQDAVMRSTYENAVLPPENGVKNFVEIDALIAAALDEVWAGKKTAQEAMDGILPKVEPLIDGWYFSD